jgi:mono/diheme cytochrome c family protein
VLLALTTDQKLGLAGTAAVFIVFALLAALMIPRTRPDFPGRRGLVPFILVTLILTIAMLGAVEVFAKEEHHGEAAAEPAETTPTETTPTETTPTETTPTATEPPPGPPSPTTTAEERSGSAGAGKVVFASAGCAGCHTFSAAGSSGATGPNLDESLDGKDADYVRRSIVEPDADVAEGYSPGVMPKTYEEQLSTKQLDDLVAFLEAG